MWSWANKCESEAEERGLSRSSSLSGDALVINVCGCQAKEERQADRAAASSTRRTRLQGRHRSVHVKSRFSSPFRASAPAGCMAKGLWQQYWQRRAGDQMHYWSAAWNIGMNYWKDNPSVSERQTPAVKTLFVAKMRFLGVSLWIFFLVTARRFLNISLSTSPQLSPIWTSSSAPHGPSACCHRWVQPERYWQWRRCEKWRLLTIWQDRLPRAEASPNRPNGKHARAPCGEWTCLNVFRQQER